MNRFKAEKYGFSTFSNKDYKYAVIAYSYRQSTNVAYYFESLEKAETRRNTLDDMNHFNLLKYVDLVDVKKVAA